MGYVEENLMSDESVVYSARLHRVIFALPLSLFVPGIVIVLAAFRADGLAWLSIFGFLLIACAGAVFLVRIVQYYTSEFAVTNKRVIVKVGLIRRHTLELLLHKVETVGVEQAILGRVLGFGTIVVTGTGGTKEPFENIADPLEFRRRVQDQASRMGAPVSPGSPEPLGDGSVRRFCPACGAAAAGNARFCSACGAPLG